MSPEPVTVNAPPVLVKPAPVDPGLAKAALPDRRSRATRRPDAAPRRPTWSKTPVAKLGPPGSDDPPDMWSGEVANMPTCTVAGSPARWAVAIARPVAAVGRVVAGDRVARRGSGAASAADAAETVPGVPATSWV